MKRKILVVDDNKLNICILSDILQKEGYDVHSLSDGTLVMKQVLSIHPDAILLDIIMPKIDGLDVCHALKSTEETKSIPVIMVTSITEGSVLRKAFDIGAFDYIKKPFDQIEIIARLNSALRFYDQQKQLEALAMRDGLTNLYNHRIIMELLENECNKAKHLQSSIAFLMFDIDNFKRINDTYGHKAGDFILKDTAKVLQDTSDVSDMIGRYGGEEFCIILMDQTLESVLSLSEKLRHSIEAHDFMVDDSPIHITMSIGISYQEPDTAFSQNDIVITADKNLYKAKRNGRNRVEY
jgi:diguanylate cyclase (GGDEF)-like protein